MPDVAIELFGLLFSFVSRTFQLNVGGVARVTAAVRFQLRECWFLLGILVSLAGGTLAWAQEPTAPVAVPSVSPPAIAQAQDDSPLTPSIRLRGSVWRMKAGIVFLRTPIGMLTLSSKTCLRDVRGSHDVLFWVHGSNVTVDIRKKADGALVHRYLSGPLTFASPEKKDVVLWTPDGEKTIPLGRHEGAVMSRQDQSPVTVEIDEQGALLGLHDLQFDLQISNAPQQSGDTRLVLKGVVSKLKSNFIFFRTPLGVVTVSSKIGVRNVKVGQEMTMWVHGNHVAIDLAQAGASSAAHRFLTGPLTYASPDHIAITLWTPQGEKSFPTDRGKSILPSVKEGSPITLELNHQGSVVDIRKPN